MLRYSAPFLLVLQTLLTGEVVVQFDPSNPEIGPYPSDFLTVPDSTQLTGRRVNLPLPNCDAQPSLCTHLGIINQLDGFNVQPRLRVRFSGPADTSTLGKGIFWDDSSKNGHWRNRRAGQPFFAVFNHEITHESQIRKR